MDFKKFLVFKLKYIYFAQQIYFVFNSHALNTYLDIQSPHLLDIWISYDMKPPKTYHMLSLYLNISTEKERKKKEIHTFSDLIKPNKRAF